MRLVTVLIVFLTAYSSAQRVTTPGRPAGSYNNPEPNRASARQSQHNLSVQCALNDQEKQELPNIQRLIQGATACDYLKLKYLARELGSQGKQISGPSDLAERFQQLKVKANVAGAPPAASKSRMSEVVQSYGFSASDADSLWKQAQADANKGTTNQP